MTKISVIIPIYNEQESIRVCLESLNKQSYKDFEVIAVDDGSTDTTLLKLRGASKTLHLRVFEQKHQGPGAARNLGAKYAKGDVLVFVDADMTFDKHFLKNLVRPIMTQGTLGTFSKFEYVSNWDNIWARCWNINEGWEAKKRHRKNIPEEDKVFRAILKKEFDKVGGFKPGGYTDDYSLSEKLGYKAKSASNAFFYHKNPSNLLEVFRQARWSAKRHYKLGKIGFFFALGRASLPSSLIIGLIYSLIHLQLAYLVFKVVYDFGVFIGILEFLITQKRAK